jgi:hypothetical protein
MQHNMIRIGIFLVVLLMLSISGCSQGESAVLSEQPESELPLAFPGAEGFGKYTSGGRGGKVLIVSSLNDSGPGSLREAVEQEEPRIILFSVSGNIELESSLEIKSGNLTIAGQSAPGDGICIRNYPVEIKSDNIIIRYIRSRLGDRHEQEADAVSAIRNKDIIVDHCSFSWASDEAASFYDNENFTLQWSIISESLNSSVHYKGEHGYGGIWGGKGASFHHNLLAHHKSRLPRFNGARTFKKDQPELELVDFRNNVIYNWKSNNSYAGERGRHNMVNNYYKPGPATDKSKRDRIVDPWEPYGTFYLSGNYLEGNAEVSRDNSKGVAAEEPAQVLIHEPHQVVEIPEHSAEAAFRAVLAGAGASLRRDAVDRRIVEETEKGSATYGEGGNGIIDSQQEVGGWPELQNNQAPKDQDKDGMADAWEEKHGLNPQESGDAAAYSLDKQYTNIEVYLNSLVKEDNK